MKLLYIVNVDWFFISHRLPIAIEAKKHGFDVVVACQFTQYKQSLLDHGFEVCDIPFSRSGRNAINEAKAMLNIRAIINEHKPDIVHAVTIKPVLYTGLVLKFSSFMPGFVVAISGLGYVFIANGFKASLRKMLASFFYKFSLSNTCQKVIFQNDSDERILTKIADLKPSDKVKINGSGVDLSKYNYTPEVSGDTLCVVMACRLLKDKGVYEFIESAQYVQEKIKNCQFILVGVPDDGNPNSICQDEIETWHDSGVIKYLGYRDDIANIFESANIVCLPSFYGEGIPKVLIEAAACGRAVVTTDNPGCIEAIIPNETGLIVPIKDSKALAVAILYLLQNKETRASMGVAARKLAEDRFDINTVVRKHIEIYNELSGE